MSDNSKETPARRTNTALSDPTPWQVRFQRLLNDMTEGEKNVGSYMVAHPEAALESISELVDTSGLGYGTVIRFCQKLGCSGFQEFKVLMARDAVTHATAPSSQDANAIESVTHRINDDISRTARNLDYEEIAKAADAIYRSSRVLCVGVASSAPLAMSLDWKIKRFGVTSSFLSDGYIMAVEATLLAKEAVLVAFSSSGATKDIVTAAHLAKDSGATVIAITNFAKAPLFESADIRLITSAARDPLVAEVPSIVSGEMVLEVLSEQIRLNHPEVDQAVLHTFDAIASRKL